MTEKDGRKSAGVCDRPEELKVRLTIAEKSQLDQAHEASAVLNGGKKLSRSHIVREALRKAAQDIIIRAKKAQANT